MRATGWRAHLLALAGLAAAVRLPFLGQRWWSDEQVTIDFVRELGAWGLLVELPTRQPHFPPYYLLVEAWTVLAPIHSARVLALVFGIAAVVGTAELGRRWADPQTGVWAGLLSTFAVPLVVQSGWLRMYTLLTCASLLAWAALEAATHRETRRAWLGWVLAAGLLAWIHPFGLVLAAVQGVYLTTRTGPWWPRVGLGILVSPAVGLLAAKAAASAGLLGRHEVGSADLVHLRSPPMPADVWYLAGALLVGRIHLLAQFAVGLWALPVAIWIAWQHRDRPTVRRLVWWVVGPVVVIGLLSYTVRPLWQLKYLVPLLTPPLTILLGLGLTHTRSRLRLPAVAGVLTVQVGVLVVRGGAAPWIALRVF